MKAIVLSSFAALSCLGFAQNNEQSSPLQLRGSLEGAYTYAGPGSDLLGLRQFDQRNRQFRLINGRIVAIYKDPKSGFGFTFEPWIGDSADILYRTDPTNSSLTKYIGQTFITFTGSNGSTVDIGKFNSWIGYESPLAADGTFLSRGLLYTLAQPVYHVGARASLTLSPQVGASAFVTNGWNQLENGVSGVALGAQIRYAANAKTNLSLGYIGGRERDQNSNRAGSFGGTGLANPGATDIHLVDLIISHDPDSQTHFALNADYASSKQPNSGNWYGISLVSKRTFAQNESLALRLEWIGDPDGIRTGQNSTLYGATLTYDRPINNGLTIRLEGRFDHANSNLFFRGGALRQDQFSVTAGMIYRF